LCSGFFSKFVRMSTIWNIHHREQAEMVNPLSKQLYLQYREAGWIDVYFLIRKIDYNNNIINNEFGYFESLLFAGIHRNVDKERSILFVPNSGSCLF